MIHKGLGIQIWERNKGNLGRKDINGKEYYTVILNINKLSMLRQDWKYVDLVCVDEFGTLSQQLLSETDYTL